MRKFSLGTYLNRKFGPPELQKQALTMDERIHVLRQYKEEMPVRYFLLKTVPSTFSVLIEKFITDPWTNVRQKLIWTFIDRYHVVKTGLKPGYYDKDQIMLHACFSLLVDYVEKECASFGTSSADERKMRFIPFYKYFWRSRELGLAELEHEIKRMESEIMDEVQARTTGGTYQETAHIESLRHQLQSAKKVLELYKWWTETRPQLLAEIESIDTTKPFLEATKHEGYGNLAFISSELRKKYPLEHKKMLDLCARKYHLEELLNEEEQKKLMELIEIRKFLWT